MLAFCSLIRVAVSSCSAFGAAHKQITLPRLALSFLAGYLRPMIWLSISTKMTSTLSTGLSSLSSGLAFEDLGSMEYGRRRWARDRANQTRLRLVQSVSGLY